MPEKRFVEIRKVVLLMGTSTYFRGAVGIIALLAASAAHAQFFLDLPSQSSTFGSNMRGYWFTAPVDFQITGLRVPTDAATGVQRIQLVRLSAPPPLFSNTTTNFSTLFFEPGAAGTDFLDMAIPISAGDVIGVLGVRSNGTSDVNSYGTANYVSSILGNPVTLGRLGSQNPLSSGPAPDLWAENGGSISRVEMRFTPAVSAAPEPGTLALSALGLGLAGFTLRKRKSAS